MKGEMIKMDYKVKGYGIEEYGVEWGIETDENGEFMYCVSSEKEAEELCEEVMKEWEE